MRIRTLIAILLLVLVTVFLVVNWRVFSTPATISLLVTSVEMPVGVVTLGLCMVGLLVFLGYAGLWQSTLLLEFRRQTKELQAQRTLAESAEASRFSDLAKLIREESAASDSRIEAALATLRQEFRETENSIAATLTEMDDRLTRGATGRDVA
jgi:uncharacterized integral membrane protein